MLLPGCSHQYRLKPIRRQAEAETASRQIAAPPVRKSFLAVLERLPRSLLALLLEEAQAQKQKPTIQFRIEEPEDSPVTLEADLLDTSRQVLHPGDQVAGW